MWATPKWRTPSFTCLWGPHLPPPASPAKPALTWGSACLGKMIETAREGLWGSGPKSVSKEQRRQARPLRPHLPSLLRSRGAVPMTRALAHTPAGHAQYSHLFETPERPRAFLALRWTGMSIRSGPFLPALGSCSQHLWPMVSPLADSCLGPIRSAPVLFPTWNSHLLLSGTSNMGIPWSVKKNASLVAILTSQMRKTKPGEEVELPKLTELQ